MVPYAQFRMSVCTHIVHRFSVPAHSTTLINVCIGVYIILLLTSFRHFESLSLSQFLNKLFTRLNWHCKRNIVILLISTWRSQKSGKHICFGALPTSMCTLQCAAVHCIPEFVYVY